MILTLGSWYSWWILSSVVTVVLSQDLCKHGRRICVDDADCINNKCVCQSGYGNGYFQCYQQNEIACFVSGDPHLATFSGAESAIDLPCRHQLASFSTTTATSGSTCMFSINGFNVVADQGVYYEAEAEIRVQVTNSMGDTTTFRMVVNDRFGTYQIDNNRARLFDQNTPVNGELAGEQFSIFYDDVNKFFVLSMPECGTTIKFRAYDPDPEQIRNQLRVPGISIVTRDPVFAPLPEGEPSRPQLCQTNQDTSTFYTDNAQTLGLDTPVLSALKHFLEDMNTNMDQIGPYQKECREAQVIFSDCPEDRKMTAINLCGPVLSDRPMVDCLRTNDVNFVDIVAQCVRSICQSKVGSCKKAQKDLEICGSYDFGCKDMK